MKIKNLILAASFLSATPGLPAQTLQYDFKDWVAAHLEYPQAAYERMYEASIPVAFKVAADGTIYDVECRVDLRGESDMIRQMADAAVKAVASAPKWLPASGDTPPEDYSLMVEFEMPKFGADMEVVPGFVRPEWVSEEYHRSYHKLTAWIASQISVPEDFHISLTGIIEKGGTLGHTKIISTSDEAVAAKVLEVIDRAPKWTPGIGHDGEPVRVFRHIYLRFESEYNDRGPESDEGNDEVMPTFRGGDTQKFREWFTEKLIYPQSCYVNGICGTVLLHFVIDKQGQVGDIEVRHSPNEALTRAALHVLHRSPKWTPGLDADGKPTRVYYTFPVNFMLPR